jgi:hypothetical protein
MALSMLIAIIAAPGLMGSQEAIRQSQSQEKREEHRARRCNLIATCVKSSARSREINGRPVVLRNGKLWIDTGTEDGAPLGHPYAGYYLPYPDSNYEGLVTTITDVAPIMNWVYVDKETHEVKYGVRGDAQPNLTGPFNCTRQDRRLTFEGWEGWCAVEEQSGLWALYFDVGDDGLRSKVAPGTRVLDVELSRKEKRFQKEAIARQQDQTTKRALDAQEDAPVDQPLAAEALVSKPGVVDEPLQVQDEPTRAEPFRIPKSIFENPPPLLAGSVFDRPPTPKTPPPAYSTAIPLVPPGPDSTVISSEPFSPSLFKIKQATGAENQQTDRSDSATRPGIPTSESQPTSLPPSKTPPSRSMSPPSFQSNPVSEKRTTPKLDRNSGTRALAQAQMFEALAAGQKPKIEIQTGSAKRISRANSNADSGSEYSRDSQEVSEKTRFESKTLTSISPTPAPLAFAASKQRVPTKRAETATVPRSTTRTASAQRPKTPPRQRALTDPTDPAVFGARAIKTAGPRDLARRPSKPSESPTVRPSTSRSSSQASNQSPRPSLSRRGTTASTQSTAPSK